ncbi:hypothetical protein F4808DRAFT_261295 [Astrocystis sublimbata]|nr:hypothetical protein F4808DRAFT_261295 [Astrocystis sublimbata]
MNALVSRFHDLIPDQQHRQIAYTTTTATALLALLAYSRHCYVEWHALGEGGVPHDVRGWLINVIAHLVARTDHRAVPAPYEKRNRKASSRSLRKAFRKTELEEREDKAIAATTTIVLSEREEEVYGPWSRTSFLPAALSARPRPSVPTTVVPQRQTSHTSEAAVLAVQKNYLAALQRANARIFASRPSALESPKFTALWLRGDSEEEKGDVDLDLAKAKWFPPRARGEVAHLHAEGSMHVHLSLVDAAEVVRRGWGERHMLSGAKTGGLRLPWGYVLIYAPRGGREGADFDVWKGIVGAALRFAARSAGFEGEVVLPS